MSQSVYENHTYRHRRQDDPGDSRVLRADESGSYLGVRCCVFLAARFLCLQRPTREQMHGCSTETDSVLTGSGGRGRLGDSGQNPGHRAPSSAGHGCGRCFGNEFGVSDHLCQPAFPFAPHRLAQASQWGLSEIRIAPTHLAWKYLLNIAQYLILHVSSRVAFTLFLKSFRVRNSLHGSSQNSGFRVSLD